MVVIFVKNTLRVRNAKASSTSRLSVKPSARGGRPRGFDAASTMSGESSSSSGQVHEARHFTYSRRMITPTHPVEGDWLKIETETAIFGAIAAGMAWWLFKQLRGLWRFWAEARARARAAAVDPTGVDVQDDASSDSEPDDDADPKKKD